jgi:hypothetical protein
MVDAVVWRLRLENGGSDESTGSSSPADKKQSDAETARSFWSFMRGIAAKKPSPPAQK